MKSENSDSRVRPPIDFEAGRKRSRDSPRPRHTPARPASATSQGRRGCGRNLPSFRAGRGLARSGPAREEQQRAPRARDERIHADEVALGLGEDGFVQIVGNCDSERRHGSRKCEGNRSFFDERSRPGVSRGLQQRNAGGIGASCRPLPDRALMSLSLDRVIGEVHAQEAAGESGRCA